MQSYENFYADDFMIYLALSLWVIRAHNAVSWASRLALSLRSPTVETYDPAGRSQTLTVPGGAMPNYTYDGALPLSESLTGAVNGTVTRTYTNDFNLSSLGVNGMSISLAYDNDGLLTQAGALTLSRDA